MLSTEQPQREALLSTFGEEFKATFDSPSSASPSTGLAPLLGYEWAKADRLAKGIQKRQTITRGQIEYESGRALDFIFNEEPAQPTNTTRSTCLPPSLPLSLAVEPGMLLSEKRVARVRVRKVEAEEVMVAEVKAKAKMRRVMVTVKVLVLATVRCSPLSLRFVRAFSALFGWLRLVLVVSTALSAFLLGRCGCGLVSARPIRDGEASTLYMLLQSDVTHSCELG